MTRTKTAMKKSATKQALLAVDNLPLPTPTEKLAPRELEVILLTAYGRTRGEISRTMSVTEETVKSYIERARVKLSAVNKAHAVTIAIMLGLIAPYAEHIPACEISRKKAALVPQTGAAQEFICPLCKRAFDETAVE